MRGADLRREVVRPGAARKAWWRRNPVLVAVLMLASLAGGLGAGVDLHERLASEIRTRMRACH